VKKLSTLLVVGAISLAGWGILKRFEIQGLDAIKLTPRTADNVHSADPRPWNPTATPQPSGQRESIRICSFNIQVFGTSKAKKPHVMDILARIVRNFDVVAIQEIRATDQDLLPNFVELINFTGRHYDFVIGPRIGRTSSKEQYAFIFDTTALEVDRNQLYTVQDPDDLLHREPLVGWFRVRGPPAEQAFTFTLVNIHTDPDETRQELDALADVFQAVLNDGRREDDVIILGDLNVDDRNFGRLGKIPGIAWVISGTPTNTRGTSQYDNFVFQSQATTEFTGRGGVFDFLREYNLSLEEALEVSDHMPIWAEFTALEGGQSGRIAARPIPVER
jgi:deoxyribonuclease-1-like protein